MKKSIFFLPLVFLLLTLSCGGGGSSSGGGSGDVSTPAISNLILIDKSTSPQDHVVPLEAVRAIAEQVFTNHQFNAVEDDHSLHDTFAALDWDNLLSLQDLSTVR